MIKSRWLYRLRPYVRVVQLVHAASGLGRAARLGAASAARSTAAAASRTSTARLAAAWLAAARSAASACTAGAAASRAAGAALGAAILRDRLHRKAAFQRAGVLVLSPAHRPPRSALLVVLLLEDLLHRLRHEIDHVLELADLLRARDLFLDAEDPDQPDPLGLTAGGAQCLAEAVEPIAGGPGRLGH